MLILKSGIFTSIYCKTFCVNNSTHQGQGPQVPFNVYFYLFENTEQGSIVC